MSPITLCTQLLKEKEDPVVLSINRKEKDQQNRKLQPLHVKYHQIIKVCYIVGIPFTMMIFALTRFVYFFGNILLAWAMLYIQNSFITPSPKQK